jgi:hypothetical protein
MDFTLYAYLSHHQCTMTETFVDNYVVFKLFLLLSLLRGGIKIFKALARLASNSTLLLAKSEKSSPKSCPC